MNLGQMYWRETWHRHKKVNSLGRQFVARVFRDGNNQSCQIHKHSTRSKYRGYFILRLEWHSPTKSYGERVLAKNLTKPELMAYIKLLRG